MCSELWVFGVFLVYACAFVEGSLSICFAQYYGVLHFYIFF